MVNFNIKRFCWLFGVIFITSFLLIRIIFGHIEDFSICLLRRDISSSISITAIIVFVFEKWLWKLPLFRGWLVPFPSLSGKWIGSISYKWNNEDNRKDISIIIHQSFLRIQIIMETDESKSRSVGGSFDVDKMRGYQRLIYSYLNEPEVTVRNRSQIHYGKKLVSRLVVKRPQVVWQNARIALGH